MIANISCISSIQLSNASNITNAPADGYITPPLVANVYGIPYSNTGTIGTTKKVKVGIFSAGGGWLPSDLQRSMTEMGLPQPTITQINVDNPANVFSMSDGVSGENTLDLYCVASIVPTANIVIFIGNNAPTYSGLAANWNNIINRMVSENCDIITMSYCIDESVLVANSLGGFLETAFANAAAKGITILAATGDHGAEGNQNAGSLQKSASYPATSPNVIAVGGTYLSLNSNGTRASEILGNSSANIGGFASGVASGGISSFFTPAPTWQSGFTANLYFSGNGYSTGNTTITGRGVPDISAPFYNYAAYYGGAGTVYTFAGTSASTPVMAGILARSIGTTGKRPTLGANTLLPEFYSNSTTSFSKFSGTLNLTSGNNIDTADNEGVGYVAQSGWDPVTGLGVPVGTKLFNLLSAQSTTIKTTNGWSPVANIYVKTGPTTWANVKHTYTKTVNGWQQTF